MAANIKGISNIIAHLENFTNITKIEICEKESSKRAVIVCSLINSEDPKLKIKSFLQERADENNTDCWYCKVFVKGEHTTATAGKDYIGFTFTLMDKVQLAVNGPQPYKIDAMDHSKFYELYAESGYLKAENKRLVAENLALQNELNELNAELDEAEQNSATVTGIDKAKEYAELANMFAPILQGLGILKAPNVVNGIGEDLELENIVLELSKLDPNLKDNLFKLLKLAKNKPQVYNMAIGYLNSM